ncbi:MAG: HIT family protein [Burkholderiales bacterium]|nr:HIT family protein [Burkholderiales bacterium]MDQ3196441.1 HIT family protein [Pseudomonadota bacterium]
MDCELCELNGGELLWRNRYCRVVQVSDADYPGFCRVIWNSHVKEMSDLSADQRRQMMDIVFAVEQAIRSTLAPDKINLASLGNLTPHLHWHVIPRYVDDAHFPSPVWSDRRRASTRVALPDLATRLRVAVPGAISQTGWSD